MGENGAAGKNHLHNNQVFDLSIDHALPQGGSKCLDDDGRIKRTGKFPPSCRDKVLIWLNDQFSTAEINFQYFIGFNLVSMFKNLTNLVFLVIF